MLPDVYYCFSKKIWHNIVCLLAVTFWPKTGKDYNFQCNKKPVWSTFNSLTQEQWLPVSDDFGQSRKELKITWFMGFSFMPNGHIHVYTYRYMHYWFCFEVVINLWGVFLQSNSCTNHFFKRFHQIEATENGFRVLIINLLPF